VYQGNGFVLVKHGFPVLLMRGKAHTSHAQAGNLNAGLSKINVLHKIPPFIGLKIRYHISFRLYMMFWQGG
jgi:hypothetical protein